MSAFKANPDACIGVFDSGIGGLSVVRALKERCGDERIVYLGDTARVPYGSRSADVVRRYALNCAHFLAKKGAKMVVIACNTASAHALAALKAALPMPVLGVIEPGAIEAVAHSPNQRIGVICTEGTRNSGCYAETISSLNKFAYVKTLACPLLVPLAEEGWCDHPATRLVAQTYLQDFKTDHIDTLVLGCTHYPILAPLLAEVIGPGVRLVDSAKATALVTQQILRKEGLLAVRRQSEDAYYATDLTERLQRVASAFLGAPLPEVEWVDLTEQSDSHHRRR